MLRKRLALITSLGLFLVLGGSSVAWAQSLGAASSFAIEATAGVTAAGGAGTVVAGNVGSTNPTGITGFPPAVVTAGFGIHANTAAAIAAQAASNQLFTDLNAGACNTIGNAEMADGNYGPGIHCFPSTANLASSSTMTISGPGIHIFRVTSALTANVSSTVLFAGADPCSVFWQVGSAATLNGTNFGGNVVSQAGVTVGVGAALTGRAFANAGPVTLAGANTVGGCSTPAAPPPCPTISLAPSTLPGGTVGTAYAQTISGSGGTAPYIFTLVSGTLPAGLTLTSAGVLAGTPTAAGSSTFTVRGTDALSCFAEIVYTIVIVAAPPVPPVCPVISLSPATLPNGTVGVAYSQTISASGGTAPYTFGVTTGTLPVGLTLTAAGVLSGTPTAAGSSTFTVTAADANGCLGTLAYTIVIAAAVPIPPGCPVITVSPTTLPNGTVGVAYTQTITASGGTGPYTFGVTIGALPAGLTLTAAGVLSGTPTTAGTAGFTVRATDANGCFANIAYTPIIAAAPAPPPVCPVITIGPVVLANGSVSVAYNQTFSGSGGTAPYIFGVTSGALPAGLTLTSAGVLSGTPTTAGTTTFTIRGTDANGCFAERTFSVIIGAAPVAVPTMSEWALIMLAAVLALVGLAAMRRKTAWPLAS